MNTALRHGPVSRYLLSVTRSLKDPNLRIGAVVDGLGTEGLGLALLVLSIPALVPSPGPFGMVFGSLVAVLALQILFGAERLWLPVRLRYRAAPRNALRATIGRALPWIGRIETVLKEERLPALTGRQARIAFAVPILLMAITIALPIPLGNFAPAVALIIMGLGFMTRDGLAVLVGLIAAGIALAWTAALVLFGAGAVAWVWSFFS